MRVAKELSDSISMVRANFEANLISHANTVKMDNEKAYAEHVKLCVKSAQPIIEHDKAELTKAIASMPTPVTTTPDVIAQAESIAKAKAKAPKAKAPKAPKAPETVTTTETKEPVSLISQ
jgi:phosphotransferase system IIA component